MLIVSQNLSNYDVELPSHVVFRINLAWISDLKSLTQILEKFPERNIFLDLPKNRTKPPNNKYSIDELKPILESFSNIKYFAISNINSINDLQPFQEILGDKIILVPKIESPEGIKNIGSICDSLKIEKIVMLDHDDLYSSMIKQNDDKNNFQKYIKSLVDYCDENNVKLLRTIGVIFGDDEKRISEEFFLRSDGLRDLRSLSIHSWYINNSNKYGNNLHFFSNIHNRIIGFIFWR